MGVKPAHAHKCAGSLNAVDVADLSDEHRRQHRSDAGQLLDRLIAPMCAQPLGDHRCKACFVAVKSIDELGNSGIRSA